MSEIVNESLERIAESLKGLPSDTKEMVRQLDIIVQGLKILRPKDMAKVFAEVETEAKNLSKTKKTSRDKIDKIFGEHEEAVEETSKSIGIMGVLTKDTGRQFGRFGRSLTRVDGSFKSFANSMGELPVIGGVFAGFAVLAGVVDSTIDAYRTVTQAGVQFQNGILGLVQSSGELGLSLDDTAKMYKTYNNTIQRIGAPAFTGFIKQVRANSGDLYALGFSYKDIVESSASFLETQRNLTGLRTLNQQEQSKLFDNTIKEFYNAAQITGVGVEEMLKSLKSLSEDPRTRLILKSLPEAGQNLMATLQSIDPKMAETVLEAIQKGALERVSNYEDIVVSGTTDLVQGIVNMAKTGSGNAAAAAFLKSHEAELMQRVGQLGRAGLDGALNFGAGLLKTMNDLVLDPKQTPDGSGTDKLSELLLKLGPQINESISLIRETLLKFTVDILGPDGAFGEILAKGLIKFIGVVTNPDNIDALIMLIDGVVRFTTVIDGFSKSILAFAGAESPLTQVILTGMIGLVAAKTALWLAKAATTNLFGSIFGALGNAVGLGVRRSPLGRFIKGTAAVAALAAGGAYLYDKMYNDETPAAAPPPPADSNDSNQSMDDTEVERKLEEERKTVAEPIVPPEMQSIVDEMNKNNQAIIEEINKKSNNELNTIPPSDNSFDKGTEPPNNNNNDEDPEIIKINKEYESRMKELAIREQLFKSKQRYLEKSLKGEKDGVSVAPAAPNNAENSGNTGNTLGTPTLDQTKTDAVGPGANLTYEKRILELAEENTHLTKVLAGISMANASQTTNTYRTLTSNIV